MKTNCNIINNVVCRTKNSKQHNKYLSLLHSICSIWIFWGNCIYFLTVFYFANNNNILLTVIAINIGINLMLILFVLLCSVRQVKHKSDTNNHISFLLTLKPFIFLVFFDSCLYLYFINNQPLKDVLQAIIIGVGVNLPSMVLLLSEGSDYGIVAYLIMVGQIGLYFWLCNHTAVAPVFSFKGQINLQRVFSHRFW